MRYIGRNTAQIKMLNTELIRQSMKDLRTATNSELARETKLSISTCSNILNELVDMGEIQVSEEIESNGGRPAKRYCYSPDYEYKLCIFANTADKINTLCYVLFNALEEVIEHDISEKEIIDIDVIDELITGIIRRYPKIKLIGIGLPAVIDDGMIKESDFKELIGKKLANTIKRKHNVFVQIENEMNYRAYGFYNAKENEKYNSVVYVTFPGDNCPGCGIVINGKVQTGKTGFAGEVEYLFDKNDADGTTIKLSEQDDIEHIAEKILVPIIILINPDIIVLTGSLIHENNISNIIKRCEASLPEEYVPEIMYRDDSTDDYIRGLVELTSEKRLENSLQ